METTHLAEYSYTLMKPPSYLKEFHVTDNEIILITGPYTPSESSLNSPDEIADAVSRLSVGEEDADLTGNPLKIDLDGNVSFEIPNKIKPMDNWNLEESRHIPIKMRLARRVVNELINRQNLPVYAACEGSGQTIVLGAQKLGSEKTCLINVLGLFPHTHEFTTLSYMEKDHKRASQTDKVDVLVQKKYFLHGTDMSKVDLKSCELNGSLAIEATWNALGYGVPKDAFMIVQTVIGHRVSLIDLQWQELTLLESFLKILADNKTANCESTKICKDERDFVTDDDFETFASNLDRFIVKTETVKETDETYNLCFENLRPETLMDTLWLLLKRCENVSSLRDYLTLFFESLAEMEKNIPNLSENVSTIGMIIKGILDGKIAVPTINFSRALELLFELGVEKLKNDYLTILSRINHSVHEGVEEKWSEFHQTKEMPKQKMRRTSVMLKLPPTNMSQNQKKLNYLRQLHAGAELMLQVEKNCVLSGNLDCFREKIFNDYIFGKNADMSDVKHLCEFRFRLENTNLEMIKERTPVMWSVKMYSNCNNVEVTTVYHLSEYKIFPPKIFNNYNDSIDCPKDTQKYYITKFRSFVDSTIIHK